MPELFHLHPMAVHFPIAFLTVGLLLALWGLAERPSAWRAETVTRLLWLGTVSAWAALGLGLLAERSAPHVPKAWETLAGHESFAWWTCGLFTGLSLYQAAARRFGWKRRVHAWLLAAGWSAAFVLLALTAREGGVLVFSHGVGVAATTPAN